jgi:hypothetical protein
LESSGRLGGRGRPQIHSDTDTGIGYALILKFVSPLGPRAMQGLLSECTSWLPLPPEEIEQLQLAVSRRSAADALHQLLRVDSYAFAAAGRR